jgi:hypothetical protein
MTEHEWSMGTDPLTMLAALGAKISRRKLRLFSCACCRRVLDRMTSDHCRNAVELSERYADGQVSWARFDLARLAAQFAMSEPADHAAWWAAHTFGLPSLVFGYGASDIAANAASCAARTAPLERTIQARLLRDIVGNPFRPPPSVSPACLAWNDSLIPKLAEAIYQERSLPSGTLDHARLAVLADALDDAGADEALADHLREPDPHVRGCWVLDLVRSGSR